MPAEKEVKDQGQTSLCSTGRPNRSCQCRPTTLNGRANSGMTRKKLHPLQKSLKRSLIRSGSRIRQQKKREFRSGWPVPKVMQKLKEQKIRSRKNLKLNNRRKKSMG